MSTVIGSRMVNGAGVKYHSMGSGAVRNVTFAVVGHVGHALVNNIASAIRGSGHLLTGEGRRKAHKKVGRPKRVGRPKKVVHRKKRYFFFQINSFKNNLINY